MTVNRKLLWNRLSWLHKIEASGCDKPHIKQNPRFLSDKGASYVSSEFANYLDSKNIKRTRGAPYHTQTQDKIERWHQAPKNKILLNQCYLPCDLENQITEFAKHYNNHRYPETSVI